MQDNDSHDGKFSYDMERQQFMESLGLTVLRFQDADVKKDIINVLMAIEGGLSGRRRPTLNRHNPLPPFIKGE